MYANVYSKANSTNATKFLKELIENAPYKVCSIQVDVARFDVSSICSTACKTDV